jgi:hypothetical protein
LIRPGRCFDIVEFNPLNLSQANKLAVKLGVDIPERTGDYSVAEIFNAQINKPKERKLGFV